MVPGSVSRARAHLNLEHSDVGIQGLLDWHQFLGHVNLSLLLSNLQFQESDFFIQDMYFNFCIEFHLLLDIYFFVEDAHFFFPLYQLNATMVKWRGRG